MKKVAAVCAAFASSTLLAAGLENPNVDSARTTFEPEGVEQEETAWVHGGVTVDFMSAYIWRNVVQTDQFVLQPCVWIDFTRLDPFYAGFSYWQGWDLSNDRSDVYRRNLNESDYNIHVGVTAWESEDKDTSLVFEAGHEWYTYHFTRKHDGRDASPSTREFYLKGTFGNPIVDIYGQCSWLYDDVQDMDPGFYYEIGFNREFELCDVLTFGLDWNTSFADKDYSYFMTGCHERGFLGTTVKAYLSWAVCDWMSLVGSVAYTGLLNSNVRDEYDAAGAADDKDVLWGGLTAKFEF